MQLNETVWKQVTACENIPLREGRCIQIEGRQIAFFRLNAGFYAVNNRCPHRGGPLADGILNGTMLVCPLHARKYNLETGCDAAGNTACLKTYPTRVENGILFVELPREKPYEGLVTEIPEPRDRPLRWVRRKPIAHTARLVESPNAESPDPA